MYYEETNTTKDHTTGIAKSLISYSKVEIGKFIREIEQNKRKTSLRTNNYCDLDSFANLSKRKCPGCRTLKFPVIRALIFVFI